jgi:hypothetical protein
MRSQARCGHEEMSAIGSCGGQLQIGLCARLVAEEVVEPKVPELKAYYARAVLAVNLVVRSPD